MRIAITVQKGCIADEAEASRVADFDTVYMHAP